MTHNDAAYHLPAKKTAADWHGGQSSSLYALCSSGAILSTAVSEIKACQTAARRDGNRKEYHRLLKLAEYVNERIWSGDIGPVPFWDTLHW
jgi:hypothetical protein